jgi:cell filamentation protein
MGNLAFAHPFLDGNGRTLILVHMELCHRSGFSIDWSRTQKDKYLTELSREIYDPRNGALDAYLSSFISEKLERKHRHKSLY